jgi:hypothetical protein
MSLDLMVMIDSLQSELFFFVEDGPLKSRMIERYLEEEAHADILEIDLDASVRVKPGEGSASAPFECRLEADGFEYQTLFSLDDFDPEESAELMAQIAAHSPPLSQTSPERGKNILRKRAEGGLLNIADAAKVVGLSHRGLKSLIPCSEIRIAGEGENKSIEEYYWETELINRFVAIWSEHQAGGGPGSEDESFIAELCCDGDQQWGREILSEFLRLRAAAGD